MAVHDSSSQFEAKPRAFQLFSNQESQTDPIEDPALEAKRLENEVQLRKVRRQRQRERESPGRGRGRRTV